MVNENKRSFWAGLKKAIASDSFKAIAILAVFALLSALVLSVVHRFTVVDQTEVLKQKIGEAYSASPIKSEFDLESYQNIENSEILNAFSTEDGACIIVSKSKKAYNAGTGITLFVIIKDGKIIDVIDYASSETPGLGTKALKDTYLAQYVGVKAEDIAYRVAFESPSDTSSVDIRFITGATKSSVGVNISVEAAATFYIREVAK